MYRGWKSIKPYDSVEPSTTYPPKCTCWCQSRVWGYVDWAIEGLETLQPRHSEAAEEIRKLIGFLRNSAGRLNYRAARKGGYPIGSGGIEAANKCISHVRLKRSGAWWYVEKANHMLALRCATYNGTFDRVFESYKTRALQGDSGNPP